MLTLERVESERDTWTTGWWSPAQDDNLHGAVESIFYWHGLPDRPLERVFPNGRASIIVQLDDCYRPLTGAFSEPFPALCVDGLWTKAFVIAAPARRARVVGITLAPLGAVRILNTNLAPLNGATHCLKDVLGKAADELGHRVSGTRDARSAIAQAIRWLRAQLARSREVSTEIAWLVQRIESARGSLKLRELMSSVTSSPSRLAGQFADHAGLTPKTFARVVRFRNAIELLASGEAAFAEIADRCGYYDQAHFNAEFKLHGGMTPSAFLAAVRYPGSSSLAEGEWDVFSNTAGAPAR